MGLGTLILGKRKSTFIGIVKVEVLQSETITISSKATENPVELGYNVTDHIIVYPIKIKSTFLVSYYSLFAGGLKTSNASDTYEVLKAQHNLKLPIFYINDLDVFPICHLESISIPRSSSDGRGLTFEVSLKTIDIILPLGVPFAGTMLGGAAGTVRQIASAVTL